MTSKYSRKVISDNAAFYVEAKIAAKIAERIRIACWRITVFPKRNPADAHVEYSLEGSM